MKRVSVLNFVVIGIAVITSGPASAQLLQIGANRAAGSVQQDATARQSDAEERERLAQRIVGDRERDTGREFDPAFKDALTTALKAKQLGMLQEIADGFKPAPLNVGDSAADLVFTPVAPCRIIDTRLGGGPLAGGFSRNFYVAGTAGFNVQGGTVGGCGIPLGPATSVMINFVAVSPQGLGNLKGSAYPNAIPATGSIVNYQALTPALNIANGLAFPICDSSVTGCAFDMTLLANGATTDVVADVLGYFSRFKKEQVRSFAASNVFVSGSGISTTCVNLGSVTIIAPVAGTALVQARATFNWNHTTQSEIDMYIDTASATCAATDWGQGKDFRLVSSSDANGFYYPTLAVSAVRNAAAGTNTYYINAKMVSGTDVPSVNTGGVSALFMPN